MTSTSLLALMSVALGGGRPLLDVPLLDYLGGEGGHSTSDAAPRLGLPPAAVYESAPEPAALFQSSQGRVNYALSSAGATATAQNYTADGVYPGLHFQPFYANDGVRYASTQGDHYWRDEHGLPSWLQVDFGGLRSVDEVSVFTLPDHPAYMTQADPSATQTFTQYGVTSFTVQYWTGSAWANVPGGSVSGNNLVWRQLNFTAVSTSRIRVAVGGAADGVARITEVEAWGAPQTRTNVALASNGGAATAQSYTADGVYPGLHFQPTYANDGRRYTGPQGDWYWRDEHGLPTWVQVDFNGQKTIDEVSVFTLADYPAYMAQSDPTPTQTFTQYGVTSFDIKYWTGSSWATVQGGSVSGNNLVWRKLNFPAVTTNKIRIVVNGAADGVARITEVEAWSSSLAGGNGLIGEYYNGDAFNTHRLTRADASVNFDWGGGSPAASVDADFFTARWTGTVVPRYSETYTFHTTTDDGVRLWINGTNVIDKWVDQAPTEWSGTVTLQAGHHYELRMEFFEHWGGAAAQLRWSSASQAKEIIPQSQLYPPGGGGGGGGGGAGYNFSAARLDPDNRTGTAGSDSYSRNYNFSIPLLSLPGRAGLDLGLTLSYNSLVWTKDAAGVTFDADEGFPAPGFRLGFPVIQPKFNNPQTQKDAYLLITPSGARVELRQTATPGVYESADSSYLQLLEGGGALTLLSTDGTRLSFYQSGGSYRCHEVRDRNGNYISAAYHADGRLDRVIDTLGRAVTFNYDAYQHLISITQPWRRETEAEPNPSQDEQHTWATFGYGAPLTLQPSFSGLTVVGDQPGASIPVLRQLGLNDGSYYKFEYNGWGQVWKTTRYAADSVDANGQPNDSHPLSYTRLNLPGSDLLAASPQPDSPRFTQARTWVEYGVMNQSAEVATGYSPWAPNMASCETLAPDGRVKTVETFATAGWQRGLTTQSEVLSLKDAPNVWELKKTTVVGLQHDGAADAPFPTNPRVTQTTVTDPQGNGRTTRVEYTTPTDFQGESGYTGTLNLKLPKKVEECDAGCAHVLRTAVTDYKIPNLVEYAARRILGLPRFQYLYQGAATASTLRSQVGFVYDEPNENGEPFLAGLPSPAARHYGGDYGTGLRWRGNANRVRRYSVDQQTGAVGAFVETRAGFNVTGTSAYKKDAAGHKNSVSYTDAFFQNINRTHTDPQYRLQTFAYPTTVTDPDGFTTSTRYNYDIGALREAQSPLPNVADNRPGPVGRRYYDRAGRVVKELTVDTGAYTKRVYPAAMDVAGTYTLLEAGKESYSAQVLDGAGRVRATAQYLPPPEDTGTGAYPSSYHYSVQKFDLDEMGRVVRHTNPAEVTAGWVHAGVDTAWVYTRQTYDWKGRALVTTHEADDSTVVVDYGGCGCAGGEVVTVLGEVVMLPPEGGAGGAWTPGRRTKRTHQDVLGRVVKTEVLKRDGQPYATTVTDYNVRDQVTAVKEYKGAATPDGSCPSGTCQQTTTTYDGHGRLQTHKAPEQTAPTQYSYNADDTTSVVTDPRGATSTYAYLNNNRHLVTSITYGAPSGVNQAATNTFTYDAVGNRKSQTDNAGSVSYEYDLLSRLSSETRRFNDLSGREYPLSYAYNLAGQLTRITDFDTKKVEYEYNRAGQLKGVSDGAGTQYASAMKYRAWGALREMAYGNGLRLEQGFDPRLRVKSYGVARPNAQPGEGVSALSDYVYEDDGRVKSAYDRTDARFNRSYSYDNVGRLIDAKTSSSAYYQSFSYDEYDNLTARSNGSWRYHDTTFMQYLNNRNTSTTVHPNGVTPYTSTWTYDADGNVTRDRDREYKYDAAGEKVRTFETSGVRSLWVYQDYDADGHRVKRVEQTQVHSGPYTFKTTYYVRSSVLGDKIIAELNEGGVKRKTYVYAGGTALALEENGQLRWVHSDPVTNSVRETNGDGYFASRQEFDPLGNDAPLEDPAPPEAATPDYLYPGAYDSSGNPYDGASGCTVDGQPMDCSFAARLVSTGAAGICPDNRCRPGMRLTHEGWNYGETGVGGGGIAYGVVDARTGAGWQKRSTPRQRRDTQRPQQRKPTFSMTPPPSYYRPGPDGQLSPCVRDLLRHHFPKVNVHGTEISPVDDARFKTGVPLLYKGTTDPAAITLGHKDIHYDPTRVDPLNIRNRNDFETAAEEVAHANQFLNLWADMPVDNVRGTIIGSNAPTYSQAQIRWAAYYAGMAAKDLGSYNNAVERDAWQKVASIMATINAKDPCKP